MIVSKVFARQILDSRGNPTIEVDLYLKDGSMGRAGVPSGASTGVHEALELRDNIDDKFHGQSVMTAVNNVNTNINKAISGKEFSSQAELDQFLIELDQTENKSNLGANAILGVSMAYAWAKSKSNSQELFEYIGEIYGNTEFKIPRPMFNVMNGGRHADWATDIQEFIVMPMKANTVEEIIEFGSEIFISLEKLLKKKGYSTNVGNEGGFAPSLKSNLEALEIIMQAVENAGYKLEEDAKFGFDIAASEFYNSEDQTYELKTEGKTLSKSDMINWVRDIINDYPVLSVEDPFDQDDWESWSELMVGLKEGIQIVGDDLLVTNTDRIGTAIEKQSCNALLVKVNQIGSITEALAAMKKAESANWNNVVSHRSGETEDVTISHIAVGTGCGQIKTGAPSRGERTAKYNELIRISEKID